MGIQAKISKAALRVAKSWPIYPNNIEPATVNGKTIEDAILFRLGFGRDSGRAPIISDNLREQLKVVGRWAVKRVWSTQS